MKRYPDEVVEYISAHVEGTTTKQLTSDLNNIFAHKYNLNFTEAKIKSYKTNHGLKSKTKGGTPKGFSLVYPAGMEEFVRNIANGKTAKELAEAVNEKYGAGTITAKKMRAYKKNHNIVSGIDCKFQPGHTPANKGKPMSPEQYERCKETMFKKGQVPPNHLNVGEYTHTTDGYLIRKIREQGTQRERFEFVHRAVWEEHNGPIPDGKMVSFLDGDKAKRLHPTQKPVDLLEYLVKTYTNPGETVLDNCMGAGSTGVACMNTGREFVGIELDPEYYQIAKERIEQHEIQG